MNHLEKNGHGWTKKFIEISNKYGKYVNISFIIDRKGLLEYKMSPIDDGPNIFLQLFKERENYNG